MDLASHPFYIEYDNLYAGILSYIDGIGSAFFATIGRENVRRK